MKYIIGNWKSHKTAEEVEGWFEELRKYFQEETGRKVVVAVPFVFIERAAGKIKELGLTINLAVQDVSQFPFGAYTGAVAAGMIKGLVEYAIVGHSERRQYFHETHQEVANKVHQLLDNGIRPVLCVDAPYAKEQIVALEEGEVNQVVIAYEPLEAIGTGRPQDPEEVKRVVAEIAKAAGEGVPIIYGGSVKPENAKTYLSIEGVSGALPGGASLEAESFWGIVSAA